MSIPDFFEQTREFYQNVLDYLDEENDINDEFQNLIPILEKQKIHQEKNELEAYINLISSISTNHHRTPNFIGKIEQLLLYFKDEIVKNFTNFQIFKFFKNNKRILYFLFNKKIIKPDQSIFEELQKTKYQNRFYLEYFFVEFQTFLNDETKEKIEKKFVDYFEKHEIKDLEAFERSRQIGENDNILCKYIREDDVENFIIYVQKIDLSLNSKINASLFETNDFIAGKKLELIEYALFFGSLQIFNYLRMNRVEVRSSLFLYSIYGMNPQIIHIIEETVKIESSEINNYLLESIKCHHNDISNYILNVLSHNNHEFWHYDVMKFIVKFSNYYFLPNYFNDKYVFYFLCKYKFVFFINEILKLPEIDVNVIVIFNSKYFNDISIYNFQNNVCLNNYKKHRSFMQLKKTTWKLLGFYCQLKILM